MFDLARVSPRLPNYGWPEWPIEANCAVVSAVRYRCLNVAAERDSIDGEIVVTGEISRTGFRKSPNERDYPPQDSPT